ncbi:putative transposase [Phaeobacter inhibens]|nr:putative transposase [Phaeobacter inhibens]
MGTKRTDEFRADAVRIALASGLTRKQVASDLGVGLSTLNKWVTAHRDTEVVPDKDLGLARKNERLRRENRILKEERDILHLRGSGNDPGDHFPDEGHSLLREAKAMRFRFIEECGQEFPTNRLCQVLGVSSRGLRAYPFATSDTS